MGAVTSVAVADAVPAAGRSLWLCGGGRGGGCDCVPVAVAVGAAVIAAVTLACP